MTTNTLDTGKEQDPNTGQRLGKALPASAKVFFDPNCPFCVRLAQFIGKTVPLSGITFVPSQEQNPKELIVEFVTPEGVSDWLSGISAWEWLLENHPSLSALNWLAHRLFIKRPTAVVLASGAETLRKICGRC